MARCPDCNKFVSYDEPQVEEQGMDVFGEEIQGEIMVTLMCADCGTELKSLSFEVSEYINHECVVTEETEETGEVEDEDEDEGEDEELEPYELESSDNWESTDRYEDKDKNGKTIKNPRYMKHYYGFKGVIEVSCTMCKETFDVEISMEEQASAYEEC